MSPEEQEQERRRKLTEWQEIEAQNRTIPEWSRIFTERRPDDLSEYVPRQPWETLKDLVDRTRRGVEVEARFVICERCRAKARIEFGGVVQESTPLPGPARELWFHPQNERRTDPPPAPTPLPPTRTESFLAKFGFVRVRREPEAPKQKSWIETVNIPCPASALIQRFRLIELPAPQTNTNPGAYPEGYKKTYNDPGEPAQS